VSIFGLFGRKHQEKKKSKTSKLGAHADDYTASQTVINSLTADLPVEPAPKSSFNYEPEPSSDYSGSDGSFGGGGSSHSYESGYSSDSGSSSCDSGSSGGGGGCD
jgi:hypothetical protein